MSTSISGDITAFISAPIISSFKFLLWTAKVSKTPDQALPAETKSNSWLRRQNAYGGSI